MDEAGGLENIERHLRRPDVLLLIETIRIVSRAVGTGDEEQSNRNYFIDMFKLFYQNYHKSSLPEDLEDLYKTSPFQVVQCFALSLLQSAELYDHINYTKTGVRTTLLSDMAEIVANLTLGPPDIALFNF